MRGFISCNAGHYGAVLGLEKYQELAVPPADLVEVRVQEYLHIP